MFRPKRVMFMFLILNRENMRKMKVGLLITILLLSVSVFSTNASAEGDDIIIESDMTWSGDMSLSQNVRVLNGGSLSLVDSDMIVSNNVQIFVDSSSSLILIDSDISSDSPPSGLAGFGYCDESNMSAVRATTASEKNVRMYIRPIQGFSLDGATAHFGNETKELSGDEDFVPLGIGPVDVWVGLTGPLCHPVSLSEISVESNGQERIWRSAADFHHRNMMVYGDTGFTIEINGHMESIRSSIFGGTISASGTLTMNDTVLDRVGPIILEEDDSEIILEGNTEFTNSTDDHDIRARSFSTIRWGDGVIGSGGLTDKWERRLAGQSLSFDAMYVSYEITGMHRFPSYSNFSNELGVSFIDGGRERVVEISWSDDNSWEAERVWSEQAIVTITDYRTAWNPEESGIGDYGGGQFLLGWEDQVVVNSGIPSIGWVSLGAVDDSGNTIENISVGNSANMVAVIENTGSASASLAINCEDVSTGSTAQISPSFPNALVSPGEQVSIPFSWRVTVEGIDSLSCRILTPTQLVEELSFGGGQFSSSSIDWTVAEDDGSSTMVPAILALLVAAGIGGYLLLSIYTKNEEELEEEDYQRTP
tara:strand:- start:5 stop:1780 length:1776 start_codon:yes stop_codon:yes gene_type:complete